MNWLIDYYTTICPFILDIPSFIVISNILNIIVCTLIIKAFNDRTDKKERIVQMIASTSLVFGIFLLPIVINLSILSVGLIIVHGVLKLMYIFMKDGIGTFLELVLTPLYKIIRNKLFGKYPSNHKKESGPYK